MLKVGTQVTGLAPGLGALDTGLVPGPGKEIGDPVRKGEDVKKVATGGSEPGGTRFDSPLARSVFFLKTTKKLRFRIFGVDSF